MYSSPAFLKDKSFWLWLYLARDDQLDKACLSLFDSKEINGRRFAESVVSLPCGTGTCLEIAITPELSSLNIGLREVSSDAFSEMGWWDEARWHPYALRWEELLKLHTYWMSELGSTTHASAAFLLAALFVAHTEDERTSYEERRQGIAKHFEQLSLFEWREIEELSKAAIIPPSEDDYRWSNEEDLGWVLSGEYPCYSLRNRPHADGSERLFPFARWSEIMSEI